MNDGTTTWSPTACFVAAADLDDLAHEPWPMTSPSRIDGM